MMSARAQLAWAPTTASDNPRLAVRPISLREANAYVLRFHRHHRPVVGHKFSIQVSDAEGQTRGVVIVGRPVGRRMDDGRTLEVTRCCTDGARNACSMLYGAARRAAHAMGYDRIITYTLAEESGSSLRASGYRAVSETPGRSWSVPTRPRSDHHPLGMKVRWEATR